MTPENTFNVHLIRDTHIHTYINSVVSVHVYLRPTKLSRQATFNGQ